MKVFDVHPEELLDRELRGGLTDTQRVLLDAHLAHCAGCRLERLLRADFAADALSAGESDMQSFVLGALQRAASVEAVVSTPALAAGTGTRRRLSAMLLVACIVLVATGAAAARTAWVERVFQVTFGTAELVSSGVRAPKRATKARVRERAVTERGNARADALRDALASRAAGIGVSAVPRANDALAEAAPEVSRAKTPAAPKVAPSHKNGKPRAPQLAPRRSVQERSAFAAPMGRPPQETDASPREATAKLAPAPEGAVAAEPESAGSEALKAVSAASLFEQANRARRSGRLDQAAALYGSLQTTFARSAEAKLSYALTARMWLDSGNAYAAYGGFEQYLASGDRALREEAMAGRALSLERLGRMHAAETAFADLLRAYPHSSYAQLAKKRLGQD